MALAASKYVALVDLVNGWSDQSGELPLLTLQRICDWAVCGRFPDRTFLLANGREIDLLELHWAMRRQLGVHAPITRDEAAKLFVRILVSKAGIESFCDDVRVKPPPGTVALKSKLLRILDKPEHLGPPDCPVGASVAAGLEARDLAIGALHILEGLLKQVRGSPKDAFAKRAINEWSSRCDDALLKVDATDDPDLRRQFADLNSQWQSLTAPEETAKAAAAQSHPSAEPPKKRGVGRPPGSGSLERGDWKLVEEMRADLLSGRHTSIAGAARERAERAGGGGTRSSREKRLCTRYAERYPD